MKRTLLLSAMMPAFALVGCEGTKPDMPPTPPAVKEATMVYSAFLAEKNVENIKLDAKG